MNAIHIDRMRFKGRESQRRLLIADLERVAWPHLLDREYLFIRQLHAVKPACQLAAGLGEQAETLRHAAVSGWRDDADRQQAVYFADYAELLACLSRDLLQKKRRWYWRQWADLFELPAENGLCKCWRQQQHLIPALISQLAKHDQLRWFCLQLTEPLTEQLCRVVCPQWGELKQCDISPADELDQPQPPPRWLAPWQTALTGMDWPVSALQLATLIALREWQPLKRQAAEMLPVYRAVLRQLQAISARRALSREIEVSFTANGQPQIKAVPLSAAEPQHTFDNSPANGGHPAEDAAAVNAKRVQGNETVTGTTGAMPVDDAQAAFARQAQPEPENIKNQTFAYLQTVIQQDRLAGGDCNYPSRLSTEQGGIFYLLNFLNLPRVQDALLSEPLTRDYPSAWGWLWQVAVAMEWRPEPGVENLFAFFCGYDQPEQLRQLPAMPQMQDLLQWGRQRYGAALFNRDIFAVPAQIETDACHVDAFYALDSVNLDVRRVGLDIDPGWLPWLGKVVKFHYGVSPLT